MFMRSVVLASVVIVAFANDEHVVDDMDSKLSGATLEPISQCPQTKSGTFHHDGMKKDQRAEATFHFDPPHDGCYHIEQRTEMDAIRMLPERSLRIQGSKCDVSAKTKVHVHYCKGLQAVGTVDQTPTGFGRQPQDQWTFIAALPFYKGYPGNVTLSNEGTEPGTLTVFDQVRFTWSGKDCIEASTHLRHARIRITSDFEHVADRLSIFGIAFKKRLAEMAGIPESSIRLTDIKSGSIIVDFMLLPIAVEGLVVSSVKQLLQKIDDALLVWENSAELCALAGGPLETCKLVLEDMGYTLPTVRALPKPKHHEQQMATAVSNDIQDDGIDVTMIVLCTIAAALILLVALYGYMSRKTKTTESCEVKMQIKEAPRDESQSAEEKPVEQDDDKSTVCPSMISDQHSETAPEPPDVENQYHPEPGLTICKVAGSRPSSANSQTLK